MYHITGKAVLCINEPFLSIAKIGIYKKKYEHFLHLTATEMTINGKIDFDSFKDFLFFLQNNGQIKSATFECTDVNEGKKCKISFVKGIFYFHKYLYNKEKTQTLPFDVFISALKEPIHSLEFDLASATISDNKLLNTALSYLSSPHLDYKEEGKDFLSFFIEKNKYLSLIFETKKITLNDEELLTCTSVPYEATIHGEELKPYESYFSSLTFDENEKREIIINNVTAPLISAFMEEDKKNIVLLNKDVVDACSQCIFRLRKISTGCTVCTPIKT